MKRILSCFILLFFLCSELYAQTWLNAQHAGFLKDDSGKAICTDSLGNVFITGYFQDSIQFGPYKLMGPGAQTDIFLVKYNSAMNVIWAKSFGTPSSEGANTVKTDPAGNIYLAGSYTSAINFGNGVTLPAPVTKGIYILKLNQSGNAIWAVNANASGTSSSFDCRGLALDAANNIYITGGFAGAADFGNSVGLSSVLHPQGYSSVDIYTAKYNSSGVCQWARSGGSYQTDDSYGIAVTAGGTSYITGTYSKPITFGVVPLTYHGPGGLDAYIAGYDLNGNLVMLKSIYSTGYEATYGISLDAFQNIYVTGMSEDFTVIDTITLTPNGNYNMFVAKFNPTGSVQWVATSIGTQHEDGRQVVVDKRGDVYVAGIFYHGGTSAFPGTVNFLSAGNNDPFIAKYNSEGEFQWAQRGGGTYNDYVTGLAVTDSGKVIIIGNHGDVATFGSTTLPSANPGLMDIFVAVLQNDLTTNPVNSLPKCAGSSLTVSFKANIPFNTGNVFTAQLSDSKGRFANAVNIGSKTSKVSGSMSATIPAGTPPGNGYRIRVISTDSVRTGSDNGKDLTIWGVASSTATAPGTDFCSGDSLKITAPSGAGYTWQWKNNGVDIAGATSSVYYAKTSGQYTVKITEPGHGCTVISNTIQATKRNLPSANITPSAATSICSGDSLVLNANTGTNLSYQWRKNNTAIPGATASSYTVTVSGSYKVKVTNVFGCTKLSSSKAVTVNPLPVASFTGLAPDYNVNASPAVLTPNPSGGIFSGPGISGYTFFPSIAGTGGPYSITYSYTDVNGCSDAETQQTTVSCNVPAVPGTISVSGGVNSVCPGESRTYTISAVSGATSYTWTAPAGGTISNGQGTVSVVINFGAGFTASKNIRVKANNACGSSANKSLLITRNNPAVPASISGQASGVCNQSGVIYSVAFTPGITYAWSFADGTAANVTSGQGTSAITVNYNANYKSDSLRVTASNACGTSDYKKKRVIAAPAIPPSIAGSTAVCANQQNVPYSIAALPSATTYTWTGPAGSHISDGIITSAGPTLVTSATSVTVDYGASGGVLKIRGNNSCASGSYKSVSIAIVCKESAVVPEEEFSASVSPNPSEADFTIRVSNAAGGHFSAAVFDVLGKMVLTLANKGDAVVIPGNALSPGIYVTVIASGNRQQILRLVKADR